MITSLFTNIIEYLISTIGAFGYLGIFILMAIESTIFPLPSELVLIPAGVSVFRGDMNVLPILVASILGSLVGSLIMYAFAYHIGRRAMSKLSEKYGRFLFMKKEHLLKTESYFDKHGEITIFVGRFLPVVRHLISLPAGLGRMNLLKFSLYTALGSGFWTIILVYLGYFSGFALAEKNLTLLTLMLALFAAIIVSLYLIIKRRKSI